MKLLKLIFMSNVLIICSLAPSIYVLLTIKHVRILRQPTRTKPKVQHKTLHALLNSHMN
jgi:hypothetical protein